jgi:Cu-Zn family superoxide dismutase
MKTLITLSACLLLSSCASLMGEFEGPTANARLQSKSGSTVSGSIKFTQIGDRVRITGDIAGHSRGKRAIHIHEKGDCSSADGMSAGGHFNPSKAKHGAPGAGHAGDLGNLTFDEYGATINMMASGISVSASAPNGIIGRAVIIHADEDDLKTDPTGNAGGRVACGVIGEASSSVLTY